MANDRKDIVAVMARLSYAYISEPDKKSGKYSTQLIIDKADKATLAKISAAIKEAKELGKSKLANSKGFIPSNIKLPLHDGDGERPGIPEYKGKVYFNCTSNKKPDLADRHGSTNVDPSIFYSGCYAKVWVKFTAFSFGGNVGITAYLQGLQKAKDGERLGGFSVVFEDLGDDEDDVDDFMPLPEEAVASSTDAELNALLGI